MGPRTTLGFGSCNFWHAAQGQPILSVKEECAVSREFDHFIAMAFPAILDFGKRISIVSGTSGMAIR
ncbi:MAG: hypothetical protein LDLANPLL_00736 [Turneriella sp.]|nr:hypothetical protein [Turneriella sp.]